MIADGGEEQFLTVEMEAEIADEHWAGGFVDAFQWRPRFEVKLSDLIFHMGVDAGVSLPVLGEAKPFCLASDDEEVLEIEERVIEHECLPLEVFVGVKEAGDGLVIVCGGGVGDVLRLLSQVTEQSQMRRPVAILVGVSRCKLEDGLFQGGEIQGL